MTDADHNSLWVLRLRMSAPAGQAVARRLRAERLLDALDLRPAGIAPSAVLIIRALQMRADLHTGRSLPAAADARRVIERHYHTAAHPARGPVPPNAQSVLFADEAELLVCLTRDMIYDHVASRWYWRQALRALPPTAGATLAQAWVAHIKVLPATLALLGPAAVGALQRLRPLDITAVALALATAYALPQQMFTPSTGTHSEYMAEVGEVVPPWRPWLPTPVATGLTSGAEALLGVALTLWHAPVLSRSERFAAQAQHWIAARSNAIARVPGFAAETEPSSHPRALPPEPSAGTAAAKHPAPAHDEPTPETLASWQQPALATTGIDTSTSAPMDHEAGRSAAPLAASARQAGVFTQLGGVLYLINLLDALGWPRYLPEGAAAPMIAGWRLLEALARSLLAIPDDHADPVWATLAALDQRDDTVPVSALIDIPARAWLATTATHICALAARRLGDPQLELLARLLAVPGQLVVSRTHVDLLLRLDSIDIAARASGLDRDPGWVPELGRVVLFHFD